MFCWTLYILAMETIPPPAPKKKEGKKLKIIEDFNSNSNTLDVYQNLILDAEIKYEYNLCHIVCLAS